MHEDSPAPLDNQAAFREPAGDDRPPDLTSCRKPSLDSAFPRSDGKHILPPTSRKGDGPSIV